MENICSYFVSFEWGGNFLLRFLNENSFLDFQPEKLTFKFCANIRSKIS